MVMEKTGLVLLTTDEKNPYRDGDEYGYGNHIHKYNNTSVKYLRLRFASHMCFWEQIQSSR